MKQGLPAGSGVSTHNHTGRSRLDLAKLLLLVVKRPISLLGSCVTWLNLVGPTTLVDGRLLRECVTQLTVANTVFRVERVIEMHVALA